MPQGSLLGPLLFLVMIKDLQSNVNICESILFADDTSLFVSGSKFHDINISLNNAYKEASTWFVTNVSV